MVLDVSTLEKPQHDWFDGRSLIVWGDKQNPTCNTEALPTTTGYLNKIHGPGFRFYTVHGPWLPPRKHLGIKQGGRKR